MLLLVSCGICSGIRLCDSHIDEYSPARDKISMGNESGKVYLYPTDILCNNGSGMGNILMRFDF